MQLHELQRTHKQKTKKRIGRGGVRGKTSGRGHKGQKAHGGHGIRPEMRDVIKKLPKLRGHGKNRARTVNSSVIKPIVVNLNVLENFYEAGESVTPRTLKERKLIQVKKGGNISVKILSRGTLSKNLAIEGCKVSESAKANIEKVGGSVKM